MFLSVKAKRGAILGAPGYDVISGLALPKHPSPREVAMEAMKQRRVSFVKKRPCKPPAHKHASVRK